ncbi:MAG: alpha/beta hydrolase [Gammaproteobacteria bacterium]|nr:MAG: alpha/beta hydrolase [Gammaproteobacteria bacterium]
MRQCASDTKLCRCLSRTLSDSTWPATAFRRGAALSRSRPGITLYVRNKHPVTMKTVPAEKIVLYVHGATYPAESTFDLPLNGRSWMDYIAQRGYDVYLVDVRGYGRSTRPPAMALPPEQNEPIVRTDTALRDFGTAVDFILKRRGVQKLSLMGWSWGTVLAGWYAAQHNERVVKLVLYAPLWIRDPPAVADTGPKLGAYRAAQQFLDEDFRVGQ